jgi:hypothetical protein
MAESLGAVSIGCHSLIVRILLVANYAWILSP